MDETTESTGTNQAGNSSKTRPSEQERIEAIKASFEKKLEERSKDAPYPGYPVFDKGIVPAFKDVRCKASVQRSDFYHGIEQLIIGWSNDGTKTAGVLARRICDYLNRQDDNKGTSSTVASGDEGHTS